MQSRLGIRSAINSNFCFHNSFKYNGILMNDLGMRVIEWFAWGDLVMCSRLAFLQSKSYQMVGFCAGPERKSGEK